MIPAYAAPLTAIDQVRVAERDGRLLVTAAKEVTTEGPYLEAHFPGRTVYPGVFILETVRQAVAAALGERGGVLADLAAVHSMRFTGAVHPGDKLLAEITIDQDEPESPVQVSAQCWRNEIGAEVARLVLEFGFTGGTDA